MLNFFIQEAIESYSLVILTWHDEFLQLKRKQAGCIFVSYYTKLMKNEKVDFFKTCASSDAANDKRGAG
jgi:hypothetical protein